MIYNISVVIKKIKNIDFKTVLSNKNLSLYLFLIVALAVAWSTARIIQKNYVLQQQITELQQQTVIQEQENKNQALKNQYYQTDAYLDLAARKYFAKSSPGERIFVVPEETASKYIKTPPAPETESRIVEQKNRILKNWQNWLSFLTNQSL